MDPSAWIKAFRALHERARQGMLSAEEWPSYVDQKEQFARSLVAAQGLVVPAGEPARRAFRVGLVFRLELRLGGKRIKGATLDLSVGGFSMRLDQAPDPNELVEYSLFLTGEVDPIVGRAKVIGGRNLTANARVSFAFQNLPTQAQERLERALFDAVLARLPA